MKILVLPSWYGTKEDHFAGSFFREQSIALQKLGHTVVLLDATFNDRYHYFEPSNFIVEKYDDEGMMTYSHTIPSFGAVRRDDGGYRHYLKRVLRLYDKIRSEYGKFDIVQAHSFMPAGIAACVIGKRENIPVVITEHSSGVLKKELPDRKIRLLKKCVAKAHSFVCVSRRLKDSVEDLTGITNKVQVIPNSYCDFFRYENDVKKIAFFSFLSVGNLVESKRNDLTISAFKKAFGGDGRIRLDIIGDGADRFRLEQQIKGLHLERQVRILGRLSRETVAERMKKCDVFVLPSDFETFGVVYVEALACGKPVIATYNGGAEDIVNKKNGILVPLRDEASLADAMKLMKENRDAYSDKEIAEECRRMYGEKEVAERYVGLYKGLC